MIEWEVKFRNNGFEKKAFQPPLKKTLKWPLKVIRSVSNLVCHLFTAIWTYSVILSKIGEVSVFSCFLWHGISHIYIYIYIQNCVFISLSLLLSSSLSLSTQKRDTRNIYIYIYIYSKNCLFISLSLLSLFFSLSLSLHRNRDTRTRKWDWWSQHQHDNRC